MANGKGPPRGKRGGPGVQAARARGRKTLGARELAHGDALAVLLDLGEVAQAGGLGHVGAGGHGQLEGVLHVVAVLEPLVQERGQGAVAGAHGGHKADGEVALGVPDVLAVGEVGGTAAAHGEQHVLHAGLVGLGERAAGVVVAIDADAEDLLHLVMVRLDEQRLLVGELLELGAGEVQHHLGATGLGMVHDLGQEVRGGLRLSIFHRMMRLNKIF